MEPRVAVNVSAPPRADREMEAAMGKLLRAGVATSCLVMLLGGVLHLFRHGGEPVSYTHFRGQPPELESVSGVLRGILAGSSQALIQLGALMLIATPVLRVALAAFGFARQKNRTFTLISLLVLALVTYGLVQKG